MKSWVLQKMKDRGQIYILPTKMGGYLSGLIFLMFLLSVGYSNNLLLIFTLTLFALNMAWVIQTHFHLKNLKLGRISVHDSHSGSPHALEIQWEKLPQAPYEWAIELSNSEGSARLRSFHQDKDIIQGDFTVPHRGLWKWDHLRISSDRPFGLYRAWKYQRIALEHFAYPGLVKAPGPFNFTRHSAEGEEMRGTKGQGDISSLGPYSGEESKRISWKHYARTGELLVKEGEEAMARSVEFRLPRKDEHLEDSLSLIASQMLECQRQEIPFSLVTAQGIRGPATHQRHLVECLRELSLW